MIVLLGVLVMLAVAVALSRATRRSSRIRVGTCCSARPWPPDDLVDFDESRSTSV